MLKAGTDLPVEQLPIETNTFRKGSNMGVGKLLFSFDETTSKEFIVITNIVKGPNARIKVYSTVDISSAPLVWFSPNLFFFVCLLVLTLTDIIGVTIFGVIDQGAVVATQICSYSLQPPVKIMLF